jgi:hypothetical protein
MNRRVIAVLVPCLFAALTVAFVGFGSSTAADDQAEEQTEHDRWMASKLNSAQQIFEDLTRGNFERLEGNARRMQVINLLEQWARDEEFERMSDYAGQLNAFEFSIKELVRHAGDQNSAGALQAYQDMTASCVRCHELIRDGDGN